MMQSVLEVKGVNKKIAGNTIVSDISFSIKKGEVFGLIGPNGSGKTTLIRMICGLMKVDQGEIIILGENIHSSYKEAISKVGAIIENPQFYDGLTGYQNLKLFANMYKDISDSRIHSIVDLVGLTERIHDQVHTYSLGMKQRLGIAQAVLHQPKILILDEPTNGLDPAGMHDLRNHIRYLVKEENISVLISTHILSEVENLCDRIGIIKNGRIIDIQSLHDQEFSGMLEIEVDCRERAVQLLSEKYKVQQNERQQIVLSTKKSAIPEINILLVENGIKVFHLAFEKNQLEHSFLQAIAEEEEDICLD